MTEPRDIRIVPTGAALGADVHGVVSFTALREADYDLLRRAWTEHLVLRFNCQSMDDKTLVDFSRHFGALDDVSTCANSEATTSPADARIRRRSSVTANSSSLIDGHAVGETGHAEAEWHADMTYRQRPPAGAILYAVEVPPIGGNTSFCNLCLAYDTLPEPLKRAIEDLVCTHDASLAGAGDRRKGLGGGLVVDPRRAPGAAHPLVRTHPVSGRKALFLGRRRNAYVHGLGLAESEQLLDVLWAHTLQPSHLWTQAWRIGDVLMWDNRVTLHRRDSFDPGARRLMRRTQLADQAPAGADPSMVS